MFLDEKQNSVAKRTVKLFPRLVIRKKSRAVARVARTSVRGRRLSTATMSERDLEIAKLRARLLKMILDNEGLRHIERNRA